MKLMIYWPSVCFVGRRRASYAEFCAIVGDFYGRQDYNKPMASIRSILYVHDRGVLEIFPLY